MKRPLLIASVAAAVLVVGGGGYALATRNQSAELPVTAGQGTDPTIPAPRSSLLPTVNIAKAVGWKEGEAPTPGDGLKVTAFATGLEHPRWLLPLANGDVLVAESDAPPKGEGAPSGGIRGWVQGLIMKQAGARRAPSPNKIVLLRDANGDGVAETRSVLVQNLFSPFGMALVGNRLYVADADKLIAFPFTPGQTTITAPAVTVTDLPGGPINHHWTKNVIASRDGTKLYVTVGSNSNVGEHGMAVEKDRAAILEIDPKTGEKRIFAYGLRNPNGMAWQPGTDQLWTVVNERDEIGSDIVPDYLTRVQFGGFYGWPWYYWGPTLDPRPKEPDSEDRAGYVIRPDYGLGPHTASLGLTFAEGAKLGPRFADGVFIGQHGSWNRKPKSGYKVIFVPFAGGKPNGLPVDVLGGFLNGKEEARGRPVGVVLDRTGALLVADDVGNRVWRVSAAR